MFSVVCIILSMVGRECHPIMYWDTLYRDTKGKDQPGRTIEEGEPTTSPPPQALFKAPAEWGEEGMCLLPCCTLVLTLNLMQNVTHVSTNVKINEITGIVNPLLASVVDFIHLTAKHT